MPQLILEAQRRTVLGKRVRRLRRQGIVPANIYGAGIESIPVQVDARALRPVLLEAGTTTIVDVQLRDGTAARQTYPVLIEHIQRHPATGELLHLDLLKVDLGKPVRAEVPVTLVGEAPATKSGGVLFHPVATLEVEALPRDLPRAIEVDVSTLEEIEAQITVGDLRLPPGVKVDAEPETVVVKVVPSKLEREVAAEEAEAAAEAGPAAEAEQAPAAEGGSARAASEEAER